MRILIVIFVFIATSFPTHTQARDLYKLPLGREVQINNEKLRAYTLEEFKILLKMDIDLEVNEKELSKYAKLQEDQVLKIDGLTKQLILKDDQIELLKKDRERITAKWVKENEKRHLAENRPNWSAWIGWSTAGVMTICVAVLAGVFISKTK